MSKSLTWTDRISMKHEDIREEFVWTTLEGKKIILKDIDINHIKNIIKYMLDRTHLFSSYDVDIFKDELKFRYMLRENKLKRILNV